MDLFPASVGVGSCTPPYDWGKGTGLVMGYFDGNTVTALWNYAQKFAMSDNSFGTTFGPSTPGLMNLVAGNTYLATINPAGPTSGVAAVANGVGTVVSDPIRPGMFVRPRAGRRSKWAERTSAISSSKTM